MSKLKAENWPLRLDQGLTELEIQCFSLYVHPNDDAAWTSLNLQQAEMEIVKTFPELTGAMV